MAVKQADVLIISAHPDDSEYGAAGTVARWVREGKKVAYVICTNGDKGTSDVSIKPARLAKIRERETLAAAKVLGVSNVVFLRYPDQGLEDTAEFRKDLVRQIRTFRPEIVACSDPYRRYLWHRDHRIAGQVALDAVYPYARDHLAYPDLFQEGFLPHNVSEVWLWGSEDINRKVDITDVFDVKLAALRCHATQLNGGAEEWVRQRAVMLAEGEKFKLAEAFHVAEAP